ncbi:tyrosine-type recombinase/integrase [Pseudovibrio sp. Alg231-02]|uniref:tyrosine-type recombinase/integrase n=1 Tax=Pseudovibrio sp. Alg231-02 TaxID=1922223 RepID=UPI000D54DBFF|nr:site-specific integrase [Pseudovibrio sp. Alg231-02]
MVNALTQIGIDALVKQGPPDKRKELADGQTPGLRLVVQPTGAMSWAYRYKAIDGSRKKVTLGPYAKRKGAGLTLSEARRKAQQAQRQRVEGIDPANAQKIERQEQVAAIAKADLQEADQFEKRFNEYMRREASQLRSADTIRAVIDRRFFPKLKTRPVTEIKRKDIQTIIDKIMDDQEPSAAIQAFAFIRRFSNWLVERGVIEVSFCNGMKPPAKPKSCDRVLSEREVRWFWEATGKMGYPGGTWARVLVLTGARRSEASHMVFSELDLERAEWSLPAERSKNKQAIAIPLSSLVIRELKGVSPLGSPPSYVFSTGTGRNGKIAPISGYSKFKSRIDEAMLEEAQQEAAERGVAADDIEIPNWTYHDLRRTCASLMGALGISPHVVEAALNHKTGQIQGLAKVYNRYEYLEERRQAFEALANHIEEIVTGEAAPSNVVPLRG